MQCKGKEKYSDYRLLRSANQTNPYLTGVHSDMINFGEKFKNYAVLLLFFFSTAFAGGAEK